MTGTETLRVGRRSVEVHRTGKALLPGDGGGAVTKGELVAYHRRIAPYMLPHLRDRPLMLERHPDGTDGPRFMQKNTPDHYPEWITRVEVPKEGGTVLHTVCDSTATLVFLADQACITLHRWESRTDRPDHPDRLVFDLDPPDGADFGTVRRAALQVRELLDEAGLPCAAMTTGSRGLHVLVPLDRRTGFDGVRAFAGEIAESLAAAHPDELTTAARKKERGARLYLDIQRNAYAQTSVAPYSVRAKPGGPVAAPVSWEQLDDPALTSRRWTVTDALDQARTEPWAGLLGRGRSLDAARRRLRRKNRTR
ncbi:ATP-dependent DNA ligase [Streptomyces triticagri]|uniref:ATP-dependent DNA ligase n=1 Tax=Streptomyces triticagri TaxID=2293568 RepID=A0A372M0Z4_9ACTN|nr:non-homologous end-joining DNA ligase [Streptomyces triticagri]RFU84606.1 ATP-dependent DNA ligase [Streptomyces triticagri]